MRTQREFFAALAKCRNGWSIGLGGGIRRGPNWFEYCPITAVVEAMTATFYEVDVYLPAAAKIGLPKKLALRIVNAADGQGHCKEPRLRKRILAALGLEEATR